MILFYLGIVYVRESWRRSTVTVWNMACFGAHRANFRRLAHFSDMVKTKISRAIFTMIAISHITKLSDSFHPLRRRFWLVSDKVNFA